LSSSTEQIVVGRIAKAHGIRGAVHVVVLSDHPARFAVGQRFLLDRDPARTLTIREVDRRSADHLVVTFEEVRSRADAEALAGIELTIRADERRLLGEGEYWPDDLEGLTVVDPGGNVLGRVSRVVLSEAQDRLVVEIESGREVEIPFVDALVPDVSLTERRVTVVPIEGLFSSEPGGS
jgi:16S rRNA processing protein RimM